MKAIYDVSCLFGSKLHGISVLLCVCVFWAVDILEHCKIYLSIDPNNDGIAVKFYKKKAYKNYIIFLTIKVMTLHKLLAGSTKKKKKT